MNLLGTICHQIVAIPIDHVHALGCSIQHLSRVGHGWTAIGQHGRTWRYVLPVVDDTGVFVEIVQSLRGCSDVWIWRRIFHSLLRIVGNVRMLFGLVIIAAIDVAITAIGACDEMLVFDRFAALVSAVVLELPWQRVGTWQRHLYGVGCKV